MKTLKQFMSTLGGYKPKPEGEQDFVKKHVVDKIADANGNGDDVFAATNVATTDRVKEKHGYTDEDDDKVNGHPDQNQTKWAEILRKYQRIGKVSEDVEQVDEVSMELLTRYKKAAGASATAADKAGDYEKGHKRFKGIQKATLKQFAKTKTEELDLDQCSIEDIDAFMQTEEFAQLDELDIHTIADYRQKAQKDGASAQMVAMLSGLDKKVQDNLRRTIKNRVTGIARAKHRMEPNRYPKVQKEESEQIDELSKATVKSYAGKKIARINAVPPFNKAPVSQAQLHSTVKGLIRASLRLKDRVATSEETELDEKHLTPAELKKREEIAQAIERQHPGMDMGKKMAIATAQAKKVAESTVPKTAKEKDLAAAAAPKNKITHKDVLVKRGVIAAESVEQQDVTENKKVVKTGKSVVPPTGVYDSVPLGNTVAKEQAEIFNTELLEMFVQLDDEEQRLFVDMLHNDKDTLQQLTQKEIE